MDSSFSFSPGSCTAIKEFICVPAMGRHDVRIESIFTFNPWRQVIFTKTWSKPSSENGETKFNRKISEFRGLNHHHITPHLTTSHQIQPHLITSLHITPQLISYFNRQKTFDDLAQALRENAEGFKLVVVNNSPTATYRTLSSWGSTDIDLENRLKIIPSCVSGGRKNFFLKNEDVMRKLVRRSCDVMSKRYQDQTGELRVET